MKTFLLAIAVLATSHTASAQYVSDSETDSPIVVTQLKPGARPKVDSFLTDALQLQNLISTKSINANLKQLTVELDGEPLEFKNGSQRFKINKNTIQLEGAMALSSIAAVKVKLRLSECKKTSVMAAESLLTEEGQVSLPSTAIYISCHKLDVDVNGDLTQPSMQNNQSKKLVNPVILKISAFKYADVQNQKFSKLSGKTMLSISSMNSDDIAQLNNEQINQLKSQGLINDDFSTYEDLSIAVTL